MDRTACVDIPNLPLQILLRTHPGWAHGPAVVVDRDKPNGVIQYANEPARQRRILPGMRYAAALSLSRRLHGGTVPEGAIQETVAGISECLWGFSPRIEAAPDEPGVFWLDASGLGRLYPCLMTWAGHIREDLQTIGFEGVVSAGFSRFGTYAAAKGSSRNVVFGSCAEEQAQVRNVRLERLNLDPRLRDLLVKLGIETLGAFAALPAEGVGRRFGAEAEALHRQTHARHWDGFSLRAPVDPVEKTKLLDYPEGDRERLAFLISRMLLPMLEELAARHQALEALAIQCVLDDGAILDATVAPATPTLYMHPIMTLLRLRIELLAVSSGVVELGLRAVGVTVSHRQLELYRERPHRNLEAAHRALANLRAQLGDRAVVHARLTDGHLPEAAYSWEPVRELRLPEPGESGRPCLVRRIYTPPVKLPPRDRNEPDGWLVAGVAEGPVDEVKGPYLVSGGWWLREIARSYFYVRTRSGRWLWIYRDQKRRRWFLHGEAG